jgi:hypothetical protein
MTNFTLPSFPGEFHWHIPPLEWNYEPANGLYILAGAKSDWFSDPAGNYTRETHFAFRNISESCSFYFGGTADATNSSMNRDAG